MTPRQHELILGGALGGIFALLAYQAYRAGYVPMQVKAGAALANTAGMITPELGMSNSPQINPNAAWETPWYLVYNYPTMRGSNDALPSMVQTSYDAGAQYGTPSERAPQL